MSIKEYESTDRHTNRTTTTFDRFGFNLVQITIIRHDPDGKPLGAPRSSIVSMDWLREAMSEI